MLREINNLSINETARKKLCKSVNVYISRTEIYKHFFSENSEKIVGVAFFA
jgi:hypothetical protein